MANEISIDQNSCQVEPHGAQTIDLVSCLIVTFMGLSHYFAREAWVWRFIDSWHSISASLYVNGTPLWMYYRLDINLG